MIENMRANGYDGDIYPVNPRGGRLLGLKVVKAIDELPRGIDGDRNSASSGNTAGSSRLCGSKDWVDRSGGGWFC